MKFNDRTWLILIAVIGIVYISLRLWNLTDSCLWFDEIFSIHAAELPISDLVWFVAQDLIHPPLFYILLKFWMFVGGESLFWLRFFPVFFSILSLISFLLLCRQLKLSASTICLAVTFFAVNGSLIKYAQEVRMYSLLQFFALASVWLFVRFLDTGKNLLPLIFVNLALVYSHYFGWFVVASEVVIALIFAREKLKQIFLMACLAFLAFAPWFYQIWQATRINADVGQNIGWMTKPNFSAVFRFVFDLLEPIYYEQSNADTAAIYLITLPIIAVGVIALGFYFAGWKNQDALEKRNFAILLIFVFVPVFIAFAASWLSPYSVWGTRHLIVAFAPFVVLQAIVLSKIEFWQIKIAAVSIVFLFFGAAFLLQATRKEPRYIWCAWENLAMELSQKEQPPAKIYAFEDLIAYHFWFALRDSDRRFQIVKINGIEGITEDKAYFLPRGFDGVQTTNAFEDERFFIAFRSKDWNEFAPPIQNLKARGFQIGVPQTYAAQGIKAFLVEVKKGN